MHAYVHNARWGVCSVVWLQEENLPWHHPGECRCRAGTGSESQEAWWGRLCHATDRLWESGVKECELHLVAELARALRLWTCSLHKQASLISLCNQVDEVSFENKCYVWKIIFPMYHFTSSVLKTIHYNLLFSSLVGIIWFFCISVPLGIQSWHLCMLQQISRIGWI